MGSNLNERWLEVCDKVCTYGDVNIPQFKAFSDRIYPQAMSEGFLLLTVQSDFMKKRVEHDFLDIIKRALDDIYSVPFVVEIDVDPQQGENSLPNQTSSNASSNASNQASAQATNKSTEAPRSTGRSADSPLYDGFDSPYPPRGDNETEIDSRPAYDNAPETATMADNISAQPSTSTRKENTFSTLSFENFVIGESNRMAYSMALQVAEEPGANPFNPLFIHGKSGLGKTHLMRAIQNYVNETRPSLTTVYADAEELVNSYTEASLTREINKSSYNNFKRKYEEADVLLIDDVQFFQGKAGTLDIFFQIFNKLIGMNKQIVLSADRAPKNIDVEERYKSRFMQGSVIDIQPPEVETKLAIVKSYLNEYKATYPDFQFTVPEDVQMYIAENSGSNIRVLKGAVNKVVYTITIGNQDTIGMEDVKILLENHFSQGMSKNITIEDIQHEVESYYKIKHSDMVSKSRAREYVFPRQVAMYLCKRMLDSTFKSIANGFNRDHSTALHSISKIEKMLLSNRDLQEQIETLEKNINEL